MTIKYFPDPNGAKTFRLIGRPGEGHYEIAKEVLASPGGASLVPADGANAAAVYEAMFRLGYVRVLESEQALEYEAPRRLTPAQRGFLARQEASGKSVQRVPSPHRHGTQARAA